jgi:hypothetical protein
MRAILLSAFLCPLFGLAQVGIGTTTPNASAKLEVNSTTQGFLPPRMTTAQRDAISSPADGLVIYNTTNNRLEMRSASASAWLTLVTLSGTETLTQKTLTNPVLSDNADPAVPPAGTVRYSTASGGVLQYSNASSWNTLTSTVQKSVVTGYFTDRPSGGTSTYANNALNVLTCYETKDRNLDFAGNTFTAPREGLYMVTVNLMTSQKNWAVYEELNIGLYDAVTNTAFFLGEYFAQVALLTYGVTSSSCVVYLTAGKQVNFRMYNSGSVNFTLYGQNYNQFSITEL